MLLLKTRKIARGFWRAWAANSCNYQAYYLEAAREHIDLSILLPGNEGYVSQTPGHPRICIIRDDDPRFNGPRGFYWRMLETFIDAEHIFIGTYNDASFVHGDIVRWVIRSGKSAVYIDTSPDRKAEWKEYAQYVNPLVEVTFAKQRWKAQRDPSA
jgi:hypothetical protein